jgi:uncharacterized protein with HEPN domain
MKPEIRDNVLLGEVLDELAVIDKRLAKGREAYYASDELRDAIAMRLISLNELLNGLSDQFYEDYPDMPAVRLRGLRNVLAHEYGNVDFDRLWNILDQDYPHLAERLRQIANHVAEQK